jgi:hypothetical protein
MAGIRHNMSRTSLLNVREYCRFDGSRKPPESIKRRSGSTVHIIKNKLIEF